MVRWLGSACRPACATGVCAVCMGASSASSTPKTVLFGGGPLGAGAAGRALAEPCAGVSSLPGGCAPVEVTAGAAAGVGAVPAAMPAKGDIPSIVFLCCKPSAGAGCCAAAAGVGATAGAGAACGAVACGAFAAVSASIGAIMPSMVLAGAALPDLAGCAGCATGAGAAGAARALKSKPHEPQKRSAVVRGAPQAGQLNWAVIRSHSSKFREKGRVPPPCRSDPAAAIPPNAPRASLPGQTSLDCERDA